MWSILLFWYNDILLWNYIPCDQFMAMTLEWSQGSCSCIYVHVSESLYSTKWILSYYLFLINIFYLTWYPLDPTLFYPVNALLLQSCGILHLMLCIVRLFPLAGVTLHGRLYNRVGSGCLSHVQIFRQSKVLLIIHRSWLGQVLMFWVTLYNDRSMLPMTHRPQVTINVHFPVMRARYSIVS